MATGKKTTEIVVPGNTLLIQSNSVTNSKLESFSLTQKKLFYYMIYCLQGAIQAGMNKENIYKQLELFTDTKKNTFVKIVIPYNIFAKHQNYETRVVNGKEYKGLTDEITELMSLQVFLDAEDKNMFRISNFLAMVDIPKNTLADPNTGKKATKAKRFANVYLQPSVAEKLIQISRNQLDQPAYYTQLFLNTIISAKNKHTPTIYVILRSWIAKGGLRIAYSKLRTLLSLDNDEYKVFSQFKAYVLKPAAADLKKHGDIWFEADQADLVYKDRGETWINFKIISASVVERNNTQLTNIMQLCTIHLQFKEKDKEKLRAIMGNSPDYELITQAIIEIKMSLADNGYKDANGDKIGNIPAYVLKSIEARIKDKQPKKRL
jgi:hypothetical protein